MNKNEASVVMAKCPNSQKTYGIRVEKKEDGAWHETWAFPLSEQAAGNEGYGTDMVSGRIVIDEEYPGCPYCGSSGWVACGNCGKLTCYNGSDGRFTCSWCGNSGEVHSADTFDLKGGGY